MHTKWDRVQEIFQEVSEVDPEDRERVLNEVCKNDPEVREEVASLLMFHDCDDDFLENDRVEQALELIHTQEEDQVPECLGPYKIRDLIGRGGMGSVYVASQTEPVRRLVALKVVNTGLNRDAFLTRFRYELQVLAMVNHPNIAHVLDAGKTVDGRPFFTMEFVPGKTLVDYCDHHGLTLAERLELFVQAAEGVNHAHRRGIIHRDLKPANILVTRIDGKPVPKVIDFGIAKIINEPLNGSTATLFGDVLGTPAYMSPEQVDGRELDTGSDVYALGMVLYELITGRLPFDHDVFNVNSVSKILDVIRTMEPPPPSKRLETAEPEVAARRGMTSRNLIRRIRGDLDRVVLKAVDKDRNHRYVSVDALVCEVRRFLNGEPVEAGTGDRIYQVKKFFRRHRKVAVIGTFLLVGLIFTSFGMFQAKEGERLAEQGKRKADIAMKFLEEMVLSASPYSHNGEVDITKMIEHAENSLDEQDIGLGDPESALLHRQIGKIFLDFRDIPKAKEHLSTAMTLYERLADPDFDELMYAKQYYALALLKGSEFRQSEALYREVIEKRAAAFGAEHLTTLRAKRGLAFVLFKIGQWETAEELYKEVFDIQLQVLGIDHEQTLVTMNNRALNLQEMGDLDGAEKLLREVIDRRKETLGSENPYTISSMYNLASLLYLKDSLDEASSLIEVAYVSYVHVLGEKHTKTLNAKTSWAQIRVALGQFEDEEITEYREDLMAKMRRHGDTSPEYFNAMNNFANILLKLGKLDEAEETKKLELQLRTRIQGPDHADTLYSRVTLGEIYEKKGHIEDAERVYRSVSEGLEDKGNMFRLFMAKGMLGACLTTQGKFVEGEPLLLQSYQYLKSKNSKAAKPLKAKLIECYQKWGKPELARNLEMEP